MVMGLSSHRYKNVRCPLEASLVIPIWYLLEGFRFRKIHASLGLYWFGFPNPIQQRIVQTFHH